MADGLPDDSQESQPTSFFSSPDLQREAGEDGHEFKEFEYTAGLFDEVKELPVSDVQTYEFANRMRLLSMGELHDDVGEYYPFTDVAVSFMPSFEDSDRHDLALVPEISSTPLSNIPEEDLLLRLLDKSLGDGEDTEEVRAYFNRLNKALWRTETSGIYVVAISKAGQEGSHGDIKIAARVSSFIFHEMRSTIEPVVMDSTNTQVGLLPFGFELAPKWLYLLHSAPKPPAHY